MIWQSGLLQTLIFIMIRSMNKTSIPWYMKCRVTTIIYWIIHAIIHREQMICIARENGSNLRRCLFGNSQCRPINTWFSWTCSPYRSSIFIPPSSCKLAVGYFARIFLRAHRCTAQFIFPCIHHAPCRFFYFFRYIIRNIPTEIVSLCDCFMEKWPIVYIVNVEANDTSDIVLPEYVFMLEN